MKRIKKLIEDHKSCWHIRKDYRIKWCFEFTHRDIPACTFYLLPTIGYNTYPYRSPWRSHIFEVLFLHWYIGIGKWEYKDEELNKYGRSSLR